jgi:hypothetical protein
MECAERGGRVKGEIEARRRRGWAYLTLIGVTVAGGLSLRPVTAPVENTQPMLQRVAVLRQAVAREPENARLLLQLSRSEFRMAKLAALRDYGVRFPEGSGEPLAAARSRYEAWLRGHLFTSPAGRRAQALARRAAQRAQTAELRAEAHLMLGAVAWERGQEREALSAFRAACRARPDWVPAWIRLAAAAATRGDSATVAAAQRRLESLRTDPGVDPSVALFTLGLPSDLPGAGGARGSLPSSRRETDSSPDPAGGS